MLLPLSVHSGSPARPYKPSNREVGRARTDKLAWGASQLRCRVAFLDLTGSARL